MTLRSTMYVIAMALISMAVVTNAAFFSRPVTRVIHYHSAPPARLIVSRHVYHEPPVRSLRYINPHPLALHYEHPLPVPLHQPLAEIVDAPHPYYLWRRK